MWGMVLAEISSQVTPLATSVSHSVSQSNQLTAKLTRSLAEIYIQQSFEQIRKLRPISTYHSHLMMILESLISHARQEPARVIRLTPRPEAYV